MTKTRSNNWKVITLATGLFMGFFVSASFAEMNIRMRISSSVGSQHSSLNPSSRNAQNIVTQPFINNVDIKPVVMSWGTLLANTRADPEDICRQIKDHIQYAEDTLPEDEWRSSEGTLSLGHGDCEDFATCIKDLCTEKGLEANIYIILSKINGKSHAIVIRKENANLWMSSNGSYERVDSISDAKGEICRNIGWWDSETSITEVNSQNMKNTAQQTTPGLI